MFSLIKKALGLTTMVGVAALTGIFVIAIFAGTINSPATSADQTVSVLLTNEGAGTAILPVQSVDTVALVKGATDVAPVAAVSASGANDLVLASPRLDELRTGGTAASALLSSVDLNPTTTTTAAHFDDGASALALAANDRGAFAIQPTHQVAAALATTTTDGALTSLFSGARNDTLVAAVSGGSLAEQLDGALSGYISEGGAAPYLFVLLAAIVLFAYTANKRVFNAGAGLFSAGSYPTLAWK